MLWSEKFITVKLPMLRVFILLALTYCSGCGSRESSPPAGTGTPSTGGAAGLPPQAKAVAEAQQRTDAAAHAARAPR